MAKASRRFSSNFKLGVVKSFLADEGSPMGLATQAGIDHSLLYHCGNRFHASGLMLDSIRENAIAEVELKIAALGGKLGQLTLVIELLKGGSSPSPQRATRGDRSSPGRRDPHPLGVRPDWLTARHLLSKTARGARGGELGSFEQRPGAAQGNLAVPRGIGLIPNRPCGRRYWRSV